MASPGSDDAVLLDEEARRLRLEQIKAETRRAIAEADKATLAAKLPSFEEKPLEGKVDVGQNVGLVAQLLAHGVLHVAGKEIADALKKARATSVLVIEDRHLIATDWPCLVVKTQLAAERKALEEAKARLAESLPSTQKDLSGITLLPMAIGAVASLIGMFRSNYSITAREVKIGTTPLVVAVTQALLDQKVPVAVDGFGLLKSELVDEFFDLRGLRQEVEWENLRVRITKCQPADVKVEGLRAEFKEALAAYYKPGTPGGPARSELEQRVKQLNTEITSEVEAGAADRALVAQVESLIARFDAFATAITSVTTPGGLPPLVAAALRERLHEESTTRHTHVVFVAVDSAGGETITKQTRWGTSGEVGFVGGAQVSYLLLELKSNTIISANTTGRLRHRKYKLDDMTEGVIAPIPADE